MGTTNTTLAPASRLEISKSCTAGLWPFRRSTASPGDSRRATHRGGAQRTRPPLAASRHPSVRTNATQATFASGSPATRCVRVLRRRGRYTPSTSATARRDQPRCGGTSARPAHAARAGRRDAWRIPAIAARLDTSPRHVRDHRRRQTRPSSARGDRGECTVTDARPPTATPATLHSGSTRTRQHRTLPAPAPPLAARRRKLGRRQARRHTSRQDGDRPKPLQRCGPGEEREGCSTRTSPCRVGGKMFGDETSSSECSRYPARAASTVTPDPRSTDARTTPRREPRRQVRQL